MTISPLIVIGLFAVYAVTFFLVGRASRDKEVANLTQALRDGLQVQIDLMKKRV